MKKVINILIPTLLLSIPMMYVSVLGTESIQGNAGKIRIPSPKDCIQTVFSDKLAMMMWIVLVAMVGVGIYILTDDHYYTTKTYKVTDKIRIPMPAGEGQHGTAWWQSDSEFNKMYPFNVINVRSGIFKELIKKGYSDLPVSMQNKKLRTYISNRIAMSERALKNASHRNRRSKNKKALELEPFKGRGGIVVGYERKGSKEYINTSTDDIHALILGYTGSGKSRCFVMQSIVNIALAGESIFINDIKGELFSYLYPFLKRLGYTVNVLDFKNMEKSMSYNLLQPVIDELKRKNLNKAIQKSMDIANVLVGEKTEQGEPLWHNGELAVISASIIACCYDNINKPKNQNLTYIYSWITKMCEQRKGLPLLLQEYLAIVGEDHPANMLLAQANVAPDKTKGSFYTSAATNLSIWTDRELFQIISKSDFELADIGKQKTAFFIILPDGRSTFYKVATLIVSQMYEALTDYAEVTLGSGRLPVRVNFMLDEFGNFPAISDFDTKLTLSRSKGIRYYLFIQSFAQLKKQYNDNTAQIIMDNCPIWIYLTVSGSETLDVIRKKLDTYTTTTYSRSSGKKQDSSTSVNLLQRDLLTNGELESLSRPYMLVMYNGNKKVSYCPDIAQWSMNKMLGMGDKKHNEKVRAFREGNRPVYNDTSAKPDYEGLWLPDNFRQFQQAYKLKRMLKKGV